MLPLLPQVLAPTRELAQQIEEETAKLAHYTTYRITSVVGGQSIEEQGSKLRKVSWLATCAGVIRALAAYAPCSLQHPLGKVGSCGPCASVGCGALAGLDHNLAFCALWTPSACT